MTKTQAAEGKKKKRNNGFVYYTFWIISSWMIKCGKLLWVKADFKILLYDYGLVL